MNARTDRPGPRLRLRVAAAFAALLAASFALFGGCGLSTGGIPLNGTDGGAACTTASQCDDGDPCTADTCPAAGVCEHTPIADGPAAPADQTPGDCKQIVCTAGEAKTVEDDNNAPTPPANSCMTGSCVGGKPMTEPATEGTSCTLKGAPGTCAGGECQVACKMASDCPDMGACKVPNCDGSTGTCTYMDISDGTLTPGVTQTPGDCHSHICLSGVDTDAEDDTDIPSIPANEAGCADAICTKGAPSNPPHASDSMCSTYMMNQPGYCDGMGHCVQCTQDDECSGTIDDCQHPACTGGTCMTAFTASGTPTMGNPPQVIGNCLQIQCDGSGTTMMVTDATNVPAAKNQGCMLGTCTGSTPGYKNAADSTPCGTGLSCSGGSCSGCTMASQCQPPPNGVCNNPTCGCNAFTCATTKPDKTTCGTVSDGCNGMIPCDNGTKDGNETDIDCGGVSNANGACATRCAQGKKCGATSDCVAGLTCADGVCCNTACGGACQACTAAKKGQGMDGVCGAVALGLSDPHGICTSAAASTCGDDGGKCNGSGGCALWPSMTQCAAPSCNGTVLTEPETCNGTGTCVAPNPAMVDCKPYKCLGSPAACATTCAADSDCADPTHFYCTGSHCVARLTQGTACTIPGSTTQCQSVPASSSPGNCVNGYCCSSACNTQCQACSNALTGGTNGTCGNVTMGTVDPSGTCKNTSSTGCKTDGKCTMTGACEDWAAGTTCSNPVSCTGSMLTTDTQCDGAGNCSAGAMMSPCPNGFACNGNMCGGSCTLGTTMGCTAGDYCAAGPMCSAQLGAGTACGSNIQCTSDACLTSCCASACMTGGACGATACAAGSGMCQYPASGSDCGSTCTNAMETPRTCDGTGTCDTGAATACPNNLGCSGSACAATCTVGTSMGCAANYTCITGGTSCLLSNGQACASNGACASNVCDVGGAGHCCTAACMTGGACGATSCNASGACVYPASGTGCGSSCSNFTLTPSTCDGSGNCNAGGPAPCSNGYLCQDTMSCATACGMTAGTAGCQSNYYCDGVGAGACQMQLGMGAVCSQDYQCVHGHCNLLVCN